MNTYMTGFRWFSEIFASLCFGMKVASALEGLGESLTWYKQKYMSELHQMDNAYLFILFSGLKMQNLERCVQMNIWQNGHITD